MDLDYFKLEKFSYSENNHKNLQFKAHNIKQVAKKFTLQLMGK